MSDADPTTMSEEYDSDDRPEESGQTDSINRRRFVKSLGVTSGAAAVGFGALTNPVVASSTNTNSELKDENDPLDEIAIETAKQPNTARIFFTTTLLGDGFQMYIAEGTSSTDESADSVQQITNAEAGVHGLSWKDQQTLRYSQDGKTYTRTTSNTGELTSATQVNDAPLPPSQGEVTTQANFVHCELGWCIRLANSDYGSLACKNAKVPRMNHGHFAVYPSGNYEGGFNIWIGKKGNCIWVGEENKTKWCTKVCGPKNGLPGVSTLKNTFKNAINRAANAAGIAIPAAIVAAIAYYLAVTTLAPPVGVPGI